MSRILFSLDTFKIFFVTCFEQFDLMSLGIVFFMFLIFRVCRVSGIYAFTVFIMFGKSQLLFL